MVYLICPTSQLYKQWSCATLSMDCGFLPMKLYTIDSVQKVPIAIDQAWDFFCNPGNLAKLTPADIGFEITSEMPSDGVMYPGQILTYNVKPVAGIKMKWATRIIHVDAPHKFIDDQLTGPYAIWHHQHHFKAIEGGTEIRDIVHYALPWFALGVIGHELVVRRKLKEIFDYRSTAVEALFGRF